jgi:hypothetical protein
MPFVALSLVVTSTGPNHIVTSTAHHMVSALA